MLRLRGIGCGSMAKASGSNINTLPLHNYAFGVSGVFLLDRRARREGEGEGNVRNF
jgi:hypothetical protein